MCEEMSAEKKLPQNRSAAAQKIVFKAADLSSQSKAVDRFASANTNSRNFRDHGFNKWGKNSSNSFNGDRRGFFGGACENHRRGQGGGGGGGGRRGTVPGAFSSQTSAENDGQGEQVASSNSNCVGAADFGSVFRPGSKKGILAEYLNFSYESPLLKRSNFYRQFTYDEPSLRHSNARGVRSSAACYNKEQYLQANCQFIMSDGYDYGAHLADPDLLVDWNCIEEIRFLDSEPPSCPICLYPPVAGQITRCGHVFCWPCILHYLALSDKQWRRCPICYESVYKNQLRSVRTLKAERFDEEKPITFRLMRREKGSNLALPASCWREKHSCIGKIHDEFGRFAKLLITNAEEIRGCIIDRERCELLNQLKEESETPESCFIREALESLEQREKTLHAAEILREMPGAVNMNRSPKTEPVYIFPIAEEKRQEVEIFTDAFNGISSIYKQQEKMNVVNSDASNDNGNRSTSESSGDSVVNSPQEPLAAPTAACSLAADHVTSAFNDKSYYFYQSDDGQPLFLHPLNVHCLVREYGGLEFSPETISGTIAQIETFTMCPDTRKRYRYLGHLPLSSVFSLIELKFADNVVSEDTVVYFSDQFEKRKRMRMRKEKDTQRLQKQAQRWERAMMLNASGTSKFTSSMSADEIPVSTFIQSAQSEIQASLMQEATATPTPAEAASASAPVISGSPEDHHSLSFAQMLRQGKPKLSAPSIGNGGAHASSADQQPITAGLGEDEIEYAPMALAHYRNEFGDALQAAFDSLKSTNNSGDKEETSNSAADSAAPATNNNSTNGKMKKKKKGKILFTL